MAYFPEIFDQFPQAFQTAPVEILVILMAILFFLFAFLVKNLSYARFVLMIAAYTYPNALVSAKGNPCIRHDVIENLLDSKDPSEIITQLRDLGMNLDVEEGADARQIERALDILYARECDIIEQIAPASIQPFIRSYCMFLEAEVIKTAIRCKHAGLTAAATEECLTPVGSVSPHLITRMAESRDIDELVYILEDAVFAEPLNEALQDYPKERDVLIFERALDGFVARNFHDSLLLIDPMTAPAATGFVLTYSDVVNIKTLLRGKRDELAASRMTAYLFPAGRDINPDMLRHLSEAKDVKEIMTQLEGTTLYARVEQAIASYDKTHSLSPVEKALDEIVLKTVSDIAAIYHFGAGPIISFLVKRKYELQNVRAILWGLSCGVAQERTRGMIICEGGTE